MMANIQLNNKRGQFMLNHNIISFNQLADWKETTEQVQDTDDKLNNYYECLIHFADDKNATRICSSILT